MRESHLQRRQSPLTVESLLIEKPDNPIGFIVEFLQKKFYFAAQGLSLRSPQEPSRYPDQAGVALGSDGLQHGRETVPAEVVADGLIEGIDDEDDDEDDADYVDDIPSLSKSSSYNRDRKRESVCAEVVLENQDDIKEFEKTAEEKMRILEILECVISVSVA